MYRRPKAGRAVASNNAVKTLCIMCIILHRLTCINMYNVCKFETSE